MIIIISWIIIIILSSIFCKYKWPNQTEFSRKIVHIGIGPLIPLALILGISKDVAISVAIIISILLFINNRFKIITAIEDVNRQSYGTVAYGLSITFLIILFWENNPNAASAGALVMSFGDGLAGLIGKNISSKKWKIWGQTKSLAGTLVMAISSFSILILLSFTVNQQFNVLPIIMITCLATSLEQVSRWGIDNLTVPIGVGYTWILMTGL